MDGLKFRQQIQNNTEDLERELLDLKVWEQEMKRKNAELLSSKKQSQSEKNQKIESKKIDQTAMKKIKSSDYKAWDMFDADKACKEIDDTVTIEEIKEDEMTEEKLEQLHMVADALKVKGNLQVKKQEWKKAIELYSEAIKICNFDPVYYANRALCHLKLDNLYLAEADCTVAIELDKNYEKAYHRRAQARIELKQYLEAKKDLEKLLKINPANKEGKSMLARVNKFLENPKRVIITEKEADNNISVESKTDEGMANGNLKEKTTTKKESVKVSKEENEIKNQSEIKIKTEKDSNVNVKDTRTKKKKKEDLPVWLKDLEGGYEVVEPIEKPPHQRIQVPMKKVSIKEVNLGASPLSKTIEQLEGKSTRENTNTLSSKSSTVSKVEKKKTEKSNRVLIEVISEEFNENTEVPEVPKTAMQFFTFWNKTKSWTLKYKYLVQINPESLPTLFKDFLESDTLNEILQVLSREFVKRKEPVYQYLENLSNVKRFRAVTLFLSADDKKVVDQLLTYAQSIEYVPDDDIARLREKYEI